MSISQQDLTELVKKAAELKKARDIIVLDIGKISAIADYFVICTGSSSTNVQAIAESIEETVKNEWDLRPRLEGYREGRWVLLDYGDVIVHIFQEEEREFYNLERLWGEARLVGETVEMFRQ